MKLVYLGSVLGQGIVGFCLVCGQIQHTLLLLLLRCCAATGTAAPSGSAGHQHQKIHHHHHHHDHPPLMSLPLLDLIQLAAAAAAVGLLSGISVEGQATAAAAHLVQVWQQEVTDTVRVQLQMTWQQDKLVRVVSEKATSLCCCSIQPCNMHSALCSPLLLSHT